MREYFLGKKYMKKASFIIFLLVFVSCFTISKNSFSEPGESIVSNGHSHEDLKRGKRFFMGLLLFKSKNKSCVSCHNLKQLDTLN